MRDNWIFTKKDFFDQKEIDQKETLRFKGEFEIYYVKNFPEIIIKISTKTQSSNIILQRWLTLKYQNLKNGKNL